MCKQQSQLDKYRLNNERGYMDIGRNAQVLTSVFHLRACRHIQLQGIGIEKFCCCTFLFTAVVCLREIRCAQRKDGSMFVTFPLTHYG